MIENTEETFYKNNSFIDLAKRIWQNEWIFVNYLNFSNFATVRIMLDNFWIYWTQFESISNRKLSKQWYSHTKILSGYFSLKYILAVGKTEQ